MIAKHEVIGKIEKDLSRFRNDFSGVLHPFRAISLARFIEELPALKVSDNLEMSRSYLASLENYGRPINISFKDSIVSLLSSSNTESSTPTTLNALANTLGLILSAGFNNNPVDIVKSSIKLFNHFENSVSGEIEKQFNNLCFAVVTSLEDYFDINWDKIENTAYDPNTFISDYEVIPEGWPKDYIPKNVLIPPQNIIIAWVAGLASTEQVMNYYKKEKAGPVLLVDRRHGFQTPNITSLIALTIFLCKNISIHYNPGISFGEYYPSVSCERYITPVKGSWFDV